MKTEKIQNEKIVIASLDQLIRAEQIKTIYTTIPPMLLSNVVAPSLLLFVLWNIIEWPILLTWTALMLIVLTIRIILMTEYQRAKPSPYDVARWGRYYTLSTFASGCLWGSIGILMLLPDLSVQILIILLLTGMSAGCVVSYAIYLPVFFAYFLPSMIPFIVVTLYGQPKIHSVIAIGAVTFVAVLSYLAYNLHKLLTQSLHLRFENIDLVKELTAQKKELTIQKETAERANAAKTKFLAAASHDLRQPLHAMSLFVSALSERVRGAVTRKLVLQLSASTDALRGLLNALLDISRLDAGVIHPRVKPCSIQELFDRLAQDCAAQAAEKNLSLTFVMTNNWVRCDATLLERILRNLISNAIRYTKRGGVLVGCRRCGEQLRIEVWDSGIGIAAHELDNIFHEFYQIDNPERDRNKGLGLGLAIVQRMTRLLDQDIKVRSVPGKGSVFAFTLPRTSSLQLKGEAPMLVAPGQLRSALVMVIDDELAIREATQIILEDWGCETVLADSAESALTVIAKTGRTPEVIIADYRLRDSKTGVEAIEALHAKYGRSIPAIIITGDTAPDRLREAQASGYHLMHKPLAPARLRALLSHVLSARNSA